MTTLTINLPDEHFLALEKTSARLNLTPEKLVYLSIKKMIASPQDDAQEADENFQDAMKYVLEKNAELYQRLAV